MRILFLFPLIFLLPLCGFSQSYLQLVDLGEACFIKKDWGCAERYLLEAVTKSPDNKYNQHTYLNLGNAQRNLGKMAEAWDSMEKGIRADPAYLPGYVNRAELRLELKDYAGALRDYGRALRQQPQHERALLGSALASKGLNDLNGANNFLKLLLQFHPENQRGKTLLEIVEQTNAVELGADKY